MTDIDLIERVAILWGSNISIRNRSDIRSPYSGNKWKTSYTVTLNGRKAIIFMKRMLDVNRLGIRRTAKIKEIIAQWENRPVKRLEPDQILELRTDFLAGLDSKALSEKYNITPECINRHIKDLRAKRKQELNHSVIKDFHAGLTRHELAEKYQKHFETICRILRRVDIYDESKMKMWAKRKSNIGV